jgi:hypothetical protein
VIFSTKCDHKNTVPIHTCEGTDMINMVHVKTDYRCRECNIILTSEQYKNLSDKNVLLNSSEKYYKIEDVSNDDRSLLNG